MHGLPVSPRDLLTHSGFPWKRQARRGTIVPAECCHRRDTVSALHRGVAPDPQGCLASNPPCTTRRLRIGKPPFYCSGVRDGLPAAMTGP